MSAASMSQLTIGAYVVMLDYNTKNRCKTELNP